MTRLKLTISFTILTSLSILGQNLSLTDLTNLCNKKNWEDVNQFLIQKNWSFFESEKGDSYKYNIITWSFDKDYYSDKAFGWFYLYTFEGFPNKISYLVFNKESYSKIQNSISSSGFKLTNSEIEDNEIISTYQNPNFTLKISTEKRFESDEDYYDEDSYENPSKTAYNITLIKKFGIYDLENGKKIDYYSDGNIEAEYNLTNGKINGFLKVYYENGELKRTGAFLNGAENGLFKEFDENGNLEAEYSMINGKKNGELKVYENGKISYSTMFKDDIKNGQHIEYYYDEETSKLNLKLIGNYIKNEKNGSFKLFYIDENSEERLFTYENYLNDAKNGKFQSVKGDSLIVGSYKNDELHGKYKVYIDLNRMLLGGPLNSDTNKLTLTVEGSFYDGLESGYWKNYDLTGTLRSEGEFLNGRETGIWKYYHANWGNGTGGNEPYSRELYLVVNFLNGELNGKATRYSYLEEEVYPCSEIDDIQNPLDTCKRMVYEKVLETTYYKNGKRNGPFEIRDSTNEIYAKGNFKDDLKEGEWFHRYSEKGENDVTYFTYQKGSYLKDKREGKWIQYYREGEISELFYYKNDLLHGEYVSFNQFNKPREKKQFNNGKLTELIIYDSLGVNPKIKFEIDENENNNYKCNRIEYSENNYTSQEYSLKTEKEINHNFFEFIFLMATSKNGSFGATAYKDGDYIVLNQDNKPLVKGKFFKEEKTGLWSFYYYDQNVKIESNFKQDKMINEKYFSLNGDLFSGEFVFYNIENGIKEERKIKDGVRNGKTLYIDAKTNKTIRKEIYKNGELK